MKNNIKKSKDNCCVIPEKFLVFCCYELGQRATVASGLFVETQFRR